MALRLRGGMVCTPQGLLADVDVVVDGERIRAIEPTASAGDEEVIDAGGCFVLPGFVEVHAHGARLFEFTAGYFQPGSGEFDGSEESWHRGLPAYARFLAQTGVANATVATWAAPVGQLARAYAFLRDYMDSDGNGRDGARLLGGNLEGTFINRDMAGAQNPARVLDPDPATFDAINRAGALRMANVVPDGGEPALALIDHLRRVGVVAGLGHTSATAEQVGEAVRHGTRYCVHFTNGPTGGSYKPFHGGGVIEAVLQTAELYAELIADMHHVNPAYVRDIIARKGTRRVMVVTDQMFATGAAEVSRFDIGGIGGIVSEDRSYVFVEGKPNTLFSSVLTMDVGFSNILSLLTRDMPGIWHERHEALGVEEALTATVRMCATNAAEMLGIDADTGSIEPGKRADLVVAAIDGGPGAWRLSVRRTLVGGVEVCR